ncbi:MAG: short-chain dehydrogenase/reductase [Steroidobacteraceae bacterium]|nr:short-chain dehydrogenase/reductase [Steroidobacteraceae bacterium]
MEFDFRDKVVLVTGGGAGIGRAACLAFAAAGACIVCVDRNRAEGEAVVAELAGQGRDAFFIAADVTDSAQVRAYVERTLERHGRIDVFVNNAGIEGAVVPLVDYPEDVFDRVMAVNVRGVFLGLKHVLPVMRAQRSGVVINTGSTGSHVGATGVSGYVASKHAVLGLTRCAALEVASDGVRVNAVCPGSTRTRMLESLADGRSRQATLAFDLATPNGRIAEPAEIAATMLYLASDAARHVVGQSIILDGGRLAM